MSIECGECERDLRGDHDEGCSRHPGNRVELTWGEIWRLIIGKTVRQFETNEHPGHTVTRVR